MGGIFLSYRRADSQDIVGRMYDRLKEHFPASRLFRDLDSLPLGRPFPLSLEESLGKADVTLVVIGPKWVSVTDAHGKPRLDDPEDFVRREVELSMSRRLPVIPVLVSNAVMPVPEDLPQSLRPLIYYHGISVRPDPDFHRDMDRLIAELLTLVPSRAGDGDESTGSATRPMAPAKKSRQVAFRKVIDKPDTLVSERVDPYVIRSFIGAGGSGLVYRAMHPGTGSEMCLKVLYPVEAGRNAIFNTVARGVRALNAISDPHVIRITDSGEVHFADCSTFYLTMELVRGEHLDVWSRGLDQGTAFARRLRLAFSLALAMSCAHTCRYIDEVGIEAHGLLHGDLKPANVLVRTADSPIILDFMLIDIQRLLDPRVVPAHLLSSDYEPVPITGAAGTPGFMAPEQEREGIVTVKSDIFGLGMTFLHLFLPGFAKEGPHAIFQSRSPAFDRLRPLLLSMVEAAPAERPDSMRSVAVSLAEVAKTFRIDLPRCEEVLGKPRGLSLRSLLRRLFFRG